MTRVCRNILILAVSAATAIPAAGAGLQPSPWRSYTCAEILWPRVTSHNLPLTRPAPAGESAGSGTPL